MILKKTFSFLGYSNRLEFFSYSLANVFLVFTVFFVVSLIDEHFDVSARSKGMIAYSVLVVLLFIIITEIAVTVRRFHDLGMSGWYLLAMLVPIYNVYLGLVLLFKGGNPSENIYGTDLE
jgi:uncharacterized membrane protein YhaH (DUF805 family)